ncbi:MAG: type II toxin-antitoxin system mRNA interferase toxin, RelE/StbE family [Calditrichaeota bacterium]|nr:type II toxin-antitoxin system mRNA interferase toxin, RelE/StbE family [Calditrichota bacterium]
MKIELSNQAEKQLRKLFKNRELYWCLNASLDQIAEKPLAGKLLNGSYKDVRSLRVGKFRILYEIHSGQMCILVIRITHRKGAY